MSASLGESLSRARYRSGLALREVARRHDISPSYVSDIEHDRRVPAEDLLRAMCRTLDVPYEKAFAASGRCPACGSLRGAK